MMIDVTVLDEYSVPSYHAVLGFPTHGSKVLLARKKDKIGKGLWNGYGGKMGDGENCPEAFFREWQEESAGTAVVWQRLCRMGILKSYNFDEAGVLQNVWHVHVLVAEIEDLIAVPESQEMGEGYWFDQRLLPFEEMIPSDQVWLSHIFEGVPVQASLYHGPGQREMVAESKIQLKGRGVMMSYQF